MAISNNNNEDDNNDNGDINENQKNPDPQSENNDDVPSEVLQNYASIRTILKQIIPILTVTTAGSIFAGFIFAEMSKQLALLPGLIVLIPAVMDTRGNIYGALGSKLSTGLHLGIINPRFEKNPNLLNAILVAVVNSIIVSLFIAVIAYGVLVLISGQSISLWALTAISLLGGIISGTILLVVVIFFGFFGYRRGLDPDNLLSPAVTITGDLFSILSLLLAADIVLEIM